MPSEPHVDFPFADLDPAEPEESGLAPALEVLRRYLISAAGNGRNPRRAMRVVMCDAWRVGAFGPLPQTKLAALLDLSPQALNNFLARRERKLGLAPIGPGRRCSRHRGADRETCIPPLLVE
jgi:hypothetical protein